VVLELECFNLNFGIASKLFGLEIWYCDGRSIFPGLDIGGIKASHDIRDVVGG
jgi:hypothetical protein